MKIAEFKNVEFNFTFVGPESHGKIKDYVRLTEYVDVEFEPRKGTDVILDEVAILDNEADKLRAELGAKIDDLKRRKEELLAITYQGDSDD